MANKIKIIEALPKIYKYLKTNYLIPNKDLNEDTKSFLTNYATISGDKQSTNQIGRLLKTIGVEIIKQSNNQGYKYKMTCVDMYKYYQSKQWIDEEVDKFNEKLI